MCNLQQKNRCPPNNSIFKTARFDKVFHRIYHRLPVDNSVDNVDKWKSEEKDVFFYGKKAKEKALRGGEKGAEYFFIANKAHAELEGAIGKG